MHRSIVTASFLILIVTMTMAKEARQIGTWVLEGSDDPDSTWTFTDKTMINIQDYYATTNAYTIDYSKNPAWLDAGPTNDQLHFIIKFADHDTFRLGMNEEMTGPRPASFDTAGLVVTYKRKRDKKTSPSDKTIRGTTKGIAFVESPAEVLRSIQTGSVTNLNQKCLTIFVLSALFKQRDLSAYDVTFAMGMGVPEVLAQAVRGNKYRTVFSDRNIKDVVWKDSSKGLAEGRFHFGITNTTGIEGTVLFKARKGASGWEVYSLAVPLKGSTDWNGAYVIF